MLNRTLHVVLIGLLFTAQTMAGNKTITNIAKPSNLQSFKFVEPAYTAQEIADTEAALAAESDDNEMLNMFDIGAEKSFSFYSTTFENQDDITIELYQNAPSIKKQFMVVKQNGKIRFVFAVSAANTKTGKVTPGGKFGVAYQLWRHMSTLYPGAGENNMDHVSYFSPVNARGFHSTTFGLYAKLGRQDSHGCVRLGRPEARALYLLIKANSSTTKIYSYAASKPLDPPLNEIELIKTQLAKDLNFIQKMLLSKNKGDVPFNERDYVEYQKSGIKLDSSDPRLKRMRIKEILEIEPEQDLGPGEKTLPNVNA